MSGKNDQNSGSVLKTTDSHPQKIKGFFDVLAEVEQIGCGEEDGATVKAGMFTTKSKIIHWEVGFFWASISGLTSALFTPLAIGVIEKIIPVFGSHEPNIFDKFFVFLLALTFSIGTAIFVGQLGEHYKGPITKQMITWFVKGIITGKVSVCLIFFLLFHWLYFQVLTEDKIIGLLRHFKRWVEYDTLNSIYHFLMDFRPVMLSSAYFLLLTTVIFVGIPLLSLWKAKRRISKKEEEDF